VVEPRIELAARPPFSFGAVVRSHGWARLPPFSWDEEKSTLSYALALPSGSCTAIRISDAGDGIEVQADAALGTPHLDHVAAAASWMFDLDLDLSEFYALIRDEPSLFQMEARGQGRLLRCATLFEDAVKTILTTNTAWSGTIRMATALVNRYGQPADNDSAIKAFPTPERLAALNESDLRESGLGYRAPYVLGLARDVATGDLDLEAFKASELPTVELRKRLLAIKGVGNYAASSLLMLLGRYETIPVDSWAKSAVSREFHGGERVGQAEVEAAFDRWGRWRGLAYWCWDWAREGE
jgi:3-methyladenine DNA glycosylase/8-oxoguanine DNA glycosylase